MAFKYVNIYTTNAAVMLYSFIIIKKNLSKHTYRTLTVTLYSFEVT